LFVLWFTLCHYNSTLYSRMQGVFRRFLNKF
jgi:hypothetical protein